MFNFLVTVVLLLFACVTFQHRLMIHGDHGLKRSQRVSYANFEAYNFQYLQGTLIHSSCEVVQAIDCAFACIANDPCVSFNVALSPNQSGKLRCELLSEDMFRSPDKLTNSQEFDHYSIQVMLVT